MATATSPKPGYKTTEFWLQLAAVVLTALYASGALANGSSAVVKVVAIAATILTALGYTVVRGAVKNTHAAAANDNVTPAALDAAA